MESMAIYRHRQRGTLLLGALGGGIALTAAIFAVIAARSAAIAVIPGAVFAVLLACFVLFGSLTVEVTPERLAFWFGPGWIRRTFPLREIRSARTVRNPWYYGWGIRITPHGWLYNVSGLDAVEIELEDGRRYRVGTDDPDRLAAAIREARELAG